ncbi:hypothetical protein K493DRAFT_313162 [Basidiobolus meristosporus CBS 931.73]|uniref:Uncharacterized protein n=1 Tax=Basidiobolus meristosporus CBS 931.73 TaxID=1314790 RepID=A0A1Y1YPR6_9FUNG|nr:hypothetical protein K493DRAFT_313162 [Basidiobolus meristosporus CBS 931.73]|eukprot:ORX99574.1 hypothetical protein K493DRAFT_313162 [Basidiobolus meristosporus CBS 931.73]
MSAENPSRKIKRITKNSSLKRRLSGIFLLDSEPKPLPAETATEEPEPTKPEDAPAPPQVEQPPSRSFFSFPSYLKKVKTRTVVPNNEAVAVEVKEPIPTETVELQESLETPVPTDESEPVVPASQLAYKISVQKMQELSRRPLIQVLLIHQTMSEVTSKLKKEGIRPTQILNEQRFSHSRGLNTPISRRRPHNTRRRSPPPPYTPTDDSEDDVPLGLLQREFMKPTGVSVLVS